MDDEGERRCLVTYRGTLADGSEGALRLEIAEAAATMADAWARLSDRFGPVDPRSIEIEIRYAHLRLVA